MSNDTVAAKVIASQLTAARQRLAELKEDAIAIAAQSREAEIEVGVLTELQQRLELAAVEEKKVQAEASGLKGATDSIVDLLADHPQGMSSEAIVGELEGRVASTSKDQRRLLFNTIHNLRSRGVLKSVEIDGNDVYRLINKEDASMNTNGG